MNSDRRYLAIKLRASGLSIKSIARELNAAQSSVSIWVRDVALTNIQIQSLRANTHSPETIEKRRQSRLKSELVKRTLIIDDAMNDIQSLSRRELWLIGIALYWAEGAKTQSTVQFSNGDPKMIKLMMRFFREVCKTEEVKLRGCIHIHEHLDVAAAEKYWQDVTSIGKERFYKTYNKPNKSSKGTRNSLPYGVCDIYVHDSGLFWKIKGWTNGIYESALKMV